jgi:hypothetical protein
LRNPRSHSRSILLVESSSGQKKTSATHPTAVGFGSRRKRRYRHICRKELAALSAVPGPKATASTIGSGAPAEVADCHGQDTVAKK